MDGDPMAKLRAQADPLTAREKVFVKEYLIDLNATQAAIRAGYSKNGANNRGMVLMKNRFVKAAIGVAMAARNARLDINADRVVQELGKIGLAPFGDAFVTTAEKKSALDSLCRHLGLFKDKIDMGVEQKTELRITFV